MMIKYYKIETQQKKSIYENTLYKSEDGKISFVMEEMYRWGWCVIRLDTEKDQPIEDWVTVDDDNEDFDIGTGADSMYEDGEVDDQCSLYFTQVKGITVEELEEKYEEEGHDYIEENFGDPEDHWKNFTGRLTVTDVTDEYSKHD
jgi:hypothetical protein